MTDLPVRGEVLPTTGAFQIGRSQVDAYMLASGDDNPIHVDADLTAQLGLPGIPVPGMLIVGLATTQIQSWPRCAYITTIASRFVSLVVLDQSLTLDAKVVAVDPVARRATIRAIARTAVLAAIIEITVQIKPA